MSSLTDFVLINSKDRASFSNSSSDFTIELRDPLEGRYKIVSAIIPNTFYNVVAGQNDKIYFNDGTNKSAVIPAGNYSVNTLPGAIKTAMDAVSSIVFTVTINSITNKMTITGDSAFSLNFGTFTSSSIAPLIGFAYTNTNSAVSHVGGNVVDLAYPRSVIVDINQTTNVQSLNGLSYGSLWFPVETNGNDVTFFKSEADYAMFITLQRCTRLQVRLRDDQGNSLSLNGADMQILLKKAEC